MHEHRVFDETIEQYFTFNASSYSHAEHVAHTRAIVSAGNSLLRALGERAPSATREVIEAALWALQYFEHEDTANAAIHCAPVRYSPITFRLARALHTAGVGAEVAGLVVERDGIVEMYDNRIAEVLRHDGAYEEDPGR